MANQRVYNNIWGENEGKKKFSDSTGSRITFGMWNVKWNFSSGYKANIYLANKLGMFFL